RQDRELLVVLPRHRGLALALAVLDRDPALRVLGDLDLVLGELAHGLGEVARLDGRAARRLDRARHGDRRGHVEVGAGDAQLVLLGLEEHGRENGERALRRDRGERGRQRVRQVGLLDGEFHSRNLLSRGPRGGRSGGLKRLLPGTCPKDPPKLLLILFSLKNLRGLEPVGAVDLCTSRVFTTQSTGLQRFTGSETAGTSGAVFRAVRERSWGPETC